MPEQRERGIGDDAREPRIQRLPALEPGDRPPCAHEGLLREVVGVARTARERPGQSMHRAPVTTHEQAERRVIAALTRGQ
jgi:hypothetical protein